MKINFDQNNITHLPKSFATLVGMIAAIIFALLGALAILRSTNSTASIGFIILPFLCAIVLFLFSLIGFCIGIVMQGIIDQSYRYRFRFLFACIIVLLTIGIGITFSSEIISTYRAVHHIHDMTTQELEYAFVNKPQKTLYGYDIYIIAAIAQNPNTSDEVLDKIAHLNDQRIYEPIGSIFNLTQGNLKGLAIIRLVVKNPNVSPYTLKYLTNSANFYLLGDLSSHPKLPEELLRKLYEKAKTNREGYLIYWGLASNPQSPPDIIRNLVTQIKPEANFDVINNALIMNPSTPEEIKKSLKYPPYLLNYQK